MSATLVLARKELRDALRNRWFILYAVCFAALSLGLASVALAGTGRFGMAGFGRTAASLVNIVLLIVPLMGLTLGAAALAGERERGTLETLLAQPIGRREVLAGKFLGLSVAIAGALAAGFGTTAAVLASRGASANVAQFGGLFLLSVLLAWSMLSVGFLISSIARRSTVALGAAIFVWLAFVFLGDLGLIGGALTLRMSASELLAAALVNPLQVFKLYAVSGMHRSLDLLGPAGLYATQTFGGILPLLLAGILTAWVVLPYATAWIVISNRGVR
ncbi:MAG: ABC transporter permease [Phycisphaerae bacterium]